MIQLFYVSSGVKRFAQDELLQLLDKARQNNEKLGITGMLLYRDGDFMQALEGDGIQVRALAAKIARDPRHKNVCVLLDSRCTEREFPDWSMGFRNLQDVDPQDVPGYSSFLDSPLRGHTFTDNPALCRELLLLFKTKPAPTGSLAE
jgi:Sensors of blue-light using FAD